MTKFLARSRGLVSCGFHMSLMLSTVSVDCSVTKFLS